MSNREKPLNELLDELSKTEEDRERKAAAKLRETGERMTLEEHLEWFWREYKNTSFWKSIRDGIPGRIDLTDDGELYTYTVGDDPGMEDGKAAGIDGGDPSGPTKKATSTDA